MKELEVVAGIIVHEGKILCLQRGKSKYAYVSFKYEFPCGKIWHRENSVDALKREQLEEMDLPVVVQDTAPYCTVHRTYPDYFLHMHAYRCTVESLTYASCEHVDARLLHHAELRMLDWAPVDLPIVDRLMHDMRKIWLHIQLVHGIHSEGMEK